ncbi:MAG: site-specific integrase [Bacteroides sp.]|nr:site-specific integrase [Bacteroides sp.]
MTKYIYKFGYNNTKAANKQVALWVVFDRTHRKVIDTGLRLHPEQWDAVHERVCNRPDAELLNMQLAKKKQAVRDLELACIRSGEMFTPDYLNQVLTTGVYRKEEPEPSLETCFTTYMYKAICRQTNLKYSSAKDQFKTHQKFAKYFPALLFRDFTYNTLVAFENHLLQEGNARSTIWKHHKNLRKYLNLAAKEGVYVFPPGKHPYGLFKVQRYHCNRDFLSEKELARMETGALPEHLEKYRQMFLFICYTGLRISDFVRIDAGMIHEDILVLKPQKTETTSATEVHLPLKILWNGRPWQIWESFGFDFPNRSKGFDLQLNAALKVIAFLLNIPKKLTCHVGRHTFLTHLAMKTGNVFKVMSLGGIRKVDTAMIYIHLAEQDNTKFLAGIEW